MEEKKTYPTAMVEITTEEYRDLITEAVASRKDAEKYSSEVWRMRDELSNANDKIANLEEENKKLINEMAKLEVEIAYYKEGV